MDNSQKIIQAFQNKFDSMSPEERKKYLADMGLKYKKVTELVPAAPKLNMSFVVSKAGYNRTTIPGVDVVEIIDSDKTIPVYVFPEGKKPHSGAAQGKIPVKKIKGMAKMGK